MTGYAADGVDWPYSDEITAGFETQLPGAVRVGAMFYYRTNRKQIGQINTLQPASAYTAHTVTIPNGPGGTVDSPKPTTGDGLQHQRGGEPAERRTCATTSTTSTPTYKGVEFTATKRFSQKWQMQMGFTLGKNEGGVSRRRVSRRRDLNDPNNTSFPDRHHRQRLRAGVPSVGQLRVAAWHQPLGFDDRQQWLPVCVDLLADPRGGGHSGHRI